jgi:hypothetical protein
LSVGTNPINFTINFQMLTFNQKLTFCCTGED